MNAKLNFASPHPFLTVATATLAAIIAMGILWAVVSLFQSRGEPMAQLAAAQRACVQHAYASERQACIKQWIAESRTTPIAAQ